MSDVLGPRSVGPARVESESGDEGDAGRWSDIEREHDERMHARDVWRVQLGTGEIRAMTLEELDLAFEDGVIDENTPVLAPFAPSWSTLGVVAGLEDTAPDLTPSLSPVALSRPPTPPTGIAFGPAMLADAATEPKLDVDVPDAAELRPRRGLVIGVVATAIVGLIALPIVITSALDASSSEPTPANAAEPPPAAAPLPPADEAQRRRAEDKAREEQAREESAREERAREERAREDKAREDKAREEKAREEERAREERAREEKARAKAAAEKGADRGVDNRGDKAAPKRQKEKVGPALLNGGDRFDPLNGEL